MLIQAGTLAVGAAVVSLCWSLDRQWLAVPIFLAFGCGRILRLEAHLEQCEMQWPSIAEKSLLPP